MESELGYFTTHGGVRLAYWSQGRADAPTLIGVHPWTFVQDEEFEDPAAESPQMRAEFERFAEIRRLISFDRRGVGASERDVVDVSLAAQISDVAALANHLRLQRFDLFGHDEGAAVAVAYAAEHPAQVARLVLLRSWIRFDDVYPREGILRMMEMIKTDWSLARRALAATVFPDGPPEAQRWYSRMLRDSVSAEMAARYLEYVLTIDLTPYLPLVEAPTLVVQWYSSRRNAFLLGIARRVAAAIPNGRSVALEVSAAEPILSGTTLEVIADFLAPGSSAFVKRAVPNVVTILFTDLASSTSLTQRLGDAKAQKLVRAHNAIVREALAAHGGTEIKHTGDGIMASFPTASGALECAVAIQRGVEAHNRTSDQQPATSDLAVHIGLNAGEPVAEESDLFGTAVQLARRICDHAQAGQILVSNVVRELAAGKGFLFSDIGEVVPKGFEEPVRLYEVRWRD